MEPDDWIFTTVTLAFAAFAVVCFMVLLPMAVAQ